MDIDPEVAWIEFRQGLRKIKKKHVELYLKYLESDDETPIKESAISKWRNKPENKLPAEYHKSVEGFDLPEGF